LRGLLASPLGFLIGVSLGALGGGGSILAVPVLVYAAGQTTRNATTTSLLLVGAAALVGMGAHYRAGRVKVGTGIAFGVAGIGGSLAGTALNRHIDPNVLLLAFSGLVVVAAWRMVVGCPTCTRVGEERALAAASSGTAVAVRRRLDAGTAAKVLVVGTAIGFLTGFFGVGGGFVIVPALTLVLGLSMPEAIGTSLLVIAINSAVSLGGRIATSSIEWSVAIPFTVAAIAGVLYGNRIAGRLDPKRSLRWFAALLLAVAVYTALRASLGLHAA
jgi:uncharacterized protein